MSTILTLIKRDTILLNISNPKEILIFYISSASLSNFFFNNLDYFEMSYFNY